MPALAAARHDLRGAPTAPWAIQEALSPSIRLAITEVLQAQPRHFLTNAECTPDPFALVPLTSCVYHCLALAACSLHLQENDELADGALSTPPSSPHFSDRNCQSTTSDCLTSVTLYLFPFLFLRPGGTIVEPCPPAQSPDLVSRKGGVHRRRQIWQHWLPRISTAPRLAGSTIDSVDSKKCP